MARNASDSLNVRNAINRNLAPRIDALMLNTQGLSERRNAACLFDHDVNFIFHVGISRLHLPTCQQFFVGDLCVGKNYFIT